MQSMPKLSKGSAKSRVHQSSAAGDGTSWLNQVERFFALLIERQIRRGIHRSVAALEATIAAFIDHHNTDPKPFRWTKSADDILASVERFCLSQNFFLLPKRTVPSPIAATHSTSSTRLSSVLISSAGSMRPTCCGAWSVKWRQLWVPRNAQRGVSLLT
jgi:hypothetical protein